jgi:penicillin-binding protein 1C
VPLADEPATRAVDERVAAMLADILSDRTARVASFGDQNVLELDFDVAAKTGTSKGYRDNVAAGFTHDVTVAVWAGNFDGSPMAGVSGISGAGPIFHSVILAAALAGDRAPRRDALSLGRPGEAARLGLAKTPVCPLSGEIPTNDCPHRVSDWRPEGDAEHAPACAVHVRVKVDVRNGLRAGPACPPAVTEERVFEHWSSTYDAWARETGRPIAPVVSSPACPIDDGEGVGPGGIRVAYPFDGAHFVIDPERSRGLQLLEVRTDPDGAELLVDGTLQKSHAWPLAAGSHVLAARVGARASPPVRIDVR